MGQHRYRQLFLFLIVLIVPVITIVVQGRRIWTQEREISSERADEIREQRALDNLEEIADLPSGSSPEQSLWGLSFALVAILTLLGGYLLWRDVRREARLAELRTQFVSSVSHELKTPLTSIRMFAELMQMSESTNAEHSGFL